MTESKLNLTPAAIAAAARGDFANFLVAATPGGIEAQEAQGQRDLCGSKSKLPVDFGYDKTGKTVLETAGVKFGEVITDDPIWQSVELPAGWKLRPTDHSMWSELVDHLERPRAKIFYKAAFYDRSCHISACTRFSVTCDYPKNFKDPGPFFGVVKDGEREIWRTAPVSHTEDYQRLDTDRAWGDALPSYERAQICAIGNGSDNARKMAIAHLDENRPDWKDASAYWSE